LGSFGGAVGGVKMLVGGLEICFIQYILNIAASSVWDRFVDLAGRSAQRVGLPRSLGQVFAALYLSPQPLGLQDLMDQLHISKGSASMSVRQLADWGAVKRVWVKGERRDFYRVEEDLSLALASFLGNMLKPRIESSGRQLADMSRESRQAPTHSEEAFYHQRIEKLCKMHRRLETLLPLVEKGFK